MLPINSSIRDVGLESPMHSDPAQQMSMPREVEVAARSLQGQKRTCESSVDRLSDKKPRTIESTNPPRIPKSSNPFFLKPDVMMSYCSIPDIVLLAQTCWHLNRVGNSTIFKRFTGSSMEKMFSQHFEYSQKVSRRLKALRENNIRLPKDVIRLSESLKHTHNFRVAQELKAFLDLRDNLILWKKTGRISFDVNSADSIDALKTAYRRIDLRIRPPHMNLNLSKQALTSIPSDLYGSFAFLKVLNVNDNFIQELPESFGKLKNLEVLDLHNNQLQQLPESFGKLTGLRKLYLRNNQLKKLPESFGKLTDLQKLWLHNNQLQKLPESFCNLTNLQLLHLYNNQLQVLPFKFGNLLKLQNLALSQNQLQELPFFFGNLSNLQRLWLHQNQLQKLPESFGYLTDLRKLHLQKNQLQELPESFGMLTNLQELLLSNNQLRELHESFGYLTDLRKLGLHYNQLRELPESLCNLTNLEPKGLHIKGNSIEGLPETLAEKVCDDHCKFCIGLL